VKERGGAGVVLVGVVAFAMVGSLVIADIGGYLAARLHAAAAADAAALAAAPMTFASFGADESPSAAAAATAAASGTRLIECRCRPDRSWSSRSVVVVVARSVDLVLFGTQTVTAASAAEFDPAALADG
jgi:hypothetical protein